MFSSTDLISCHSQDDRLCEQYSKWPLDVLPDPDLERTTVLSRECIMAASFLLHLLTLPL